MWKCNPKHQLAPSVYSVVAEHKKKNASNVWICSIPLIPFTLFNRIHAMAVCDDAAFFHNEINTLLKQIGLQEDSQFALYSEELINIVEGVKGRGYGSATHEELEFILETAATTGIFLDPVYTGKAAFHMVKKMQTLPESFKGKKILFYHSGSVLGLMDGCMTELLQSKQSYHQIYDWMSRDAFPLAKQ
ncbi:Bifunctional D-cysteine desulfhydrase/1-aminocyclopropane-1-carboxylate deaminase, mitochondrial [Holothuria leucospilota]|uniref:Bifunctional D-cysteine desulfhydrase/1-aminocyclopropane-1-carboxylate deaminase, mitochondrial n=1 Tax=Holothuria leucospilota TaxID=206669 RepID=A0A9Q1H278_HOLLE|nr:Bifunctional D-cysteine desulfhydrase/1-aminocyclopropane-1-carboxylate deaminase, mitochondrial [Holothuria leucospilota]